MQQENKTGITSFSICGRLSNHVMTTCRYWRSKYSKLSYLWNLKGKSRNSATQLFKLLSRSQTLSWLKFLHSSQRYLLAWRTYGYTLLVSCGWFSWVVSQMYRCGSIMKPRLKPNWVRAFEYLVVIGERQYSSTSSHKRKAS